MRENGAQGDNVQTSEFYEMFATVVFVSDSHISDAPTLAVVQKCECQKLKSVKFWGLTAVFLKTQVFVGVMPSRPVNNYQCFQGQRYSRFQDRTACP